MECTAHHRLMIYTVTISKGGFLSLRSKCKFAISFEPLAIQQIKMYGSAEPLTEENVNRIKLHRFFPDTWEF